VDINWGDGSPDTRVTLAAGILSFGPLQHQYLDNLPGNAPYTIAATVLKGESADSLTTGQIPDIVVSHGPGSGPADAVLSLYDGTTGTFIKDLINGSAQLDGTLLYGPDGNIYVPSSTSQAVLRFNGLTGAPLPSPGNMGAIFTAPGYLSSFASVLFGPDGNLYVADFAANQLLRFNGSTGAPLPAASQSGATWIPAGADGLLTPWNLYFGTDGDLYVVNYDLNVAQGGTGTVVQILRFDLQGNFLGVFATMQGGTYFNDMTVGPDGNLYFSTTNGSGVFRYSGVTGAPLPAPGQTGAIFAAPGSGGMTFAEGLRFGPDGDLYVNGVVTGRGTTVIRYDGTTGAFLNIATSTGLGWTGDVMFMPQQVTASTQLTVYNVAPTNLVLHVSSSTINEGGMVTLTGTFTDPGTLDTHTVNINWGDGTTSTVSVAAGVLSFSSQPHQYLDNQFQNAPYTITSSVSDNDGGNTPHFVVSDLNSGKVQVYDSTSNTLLYNLLLPPSSGAGDVQLGPDGDLYIGNYSSGSNIQRYGPDGQFLGVFASSGGLSYPAGLTFGPDGNLYVDSYGNDQILEYQGPGGAMPGSFVKIFASLGQYSAFSYPLGITFDPAGNLYVTVTNNATNGGGAVLRFNSAGMPYPSNAGPGGAVFLPAGYDGLMTPIGVRFGPDGKFYVSSLENATILRFDVNGAIITPDPAPGYPGTATFISGGIPSVWGFTFAPDGSIYVTSGNPFGHGTTAGSIARYNGTTGAFLNTVVPLGANGLQAPEELVFIQPQVATIQVAVTNVAPGNVQLQATTTAGVPVSTINEGDIIALQGTFSDPGTLDTHVVDINWGDGSPVTTVTLGAHVLGFGQDLSITHQYLDNPGPGISGTFTIQVNVRDKDGGSVGPGLLVGSSNDAFLRYDSMSGAFSDTPIPSALNGGLAGIAGAVYGPDGNLYVVSSSTNSVLRYDGQTGAFLGVFVALGSGGLTQPSSLTFGPDGNLYVASTNGNDVLRYNGATGAPMPASGQTGAIFVPVSSGSLEQPAGLAFGPDGNLYVSSSGNDDVLRYNPLTGAFVNPFLAGGPGGLHLPGELLFRPDGNLYVLSSGTGSILRFNATSGAFVDTFVAAGSGGLAGADSFAFGPDGNLYVGSAGTQDVLSFSGTSGGFLATFVAAGSGGLATPTIVVFTPGGPYSTTSITVNNVAPVVTNLTLSATSINENDPPITLNGTFTDPGVLDTHTVDINWGDGSADTTLQLAADVLNFSALHRYIDDPAGQPFGSFPITVTVTDNDGASGSLSTSIQVNDVPPTVDLPGPSNLVIGQPFAVAATEASPVDEAAGFTYTIYWGDGSAFQVVPATPNNGTGLLVDHSFPTGSFTVTVTATNDDGQPSLPVSQNIVVSVAALESTGSNTTLAVGSSSSNTDTDMVTVTQTVQDGVAMTNVTVTGGSDVNGTTTASFDTETFGSVDVFAAAGNVVDTTGVTSAPVVIDDAPGNLTIHAGSSDTTAKLNIVSTVSISVTGGVNTLNFAPTQYGVNFNAALDQGQMQALDATGSHFLAISGAFQNIVGTNFNDTLYAADPIFNGLTYAGTNITEGTGQDKIFGTLATTVMAPGSDSQFTQTLDQADLNILSQVGANATMLGALRSTVQMTGGKSFAQAGVLTNLTLSGGNNQFVGSIDANTESTLASLVQGFNATQTASVLGGFNTTVSLTGGFNTATAGLLTTLNLDGGNSQYTESIDANALNLIHAATQGFSATGTATVLGGFNTTVSLTGGFNSAAAGLLAHLTLAGGNSNYVETIDPATQSMVASMVQGFNATGTAAVLGGFNTTVSLTGGFNTVQASVLANVNFAYAQHNTFIGTLDPTSMNLVSSVVNGFNTAPAGVTGGFNATNTAAVLGGFNTTVSLTGGFNTAQAGVLSNITMANGNNSYIGIIDANAESLVSSVLNSFDSAAMQADSFSATGTATVLGGFNTTVSLTGGYNQAQAGLLTKLSLAGGNNTYVEALDANSASLLSAVVNGFNAVAAGIGGFNATNTAAVVGGFNTTVSLTGGYGKAEASILTTVTADTGHNLFVGTLDPTSASMVASVIAGFNATSTATVLGGFNTTVSLTGGFNTGEAGILSNLTLAGGNNLYLEQLDPNAKNLVTSVISSFNATGTATVLGGFNTTVSLTGGFSLAQAGILTHVKMDTGHNVYIGTLDAPRPDGTLDTTEADLVAAVVNGFNNAPASVTGGFSATGTAAVVGGFNTTVSLTGGFNTVQAGVLAQVTQSGGGYNTYVENLDATAANLVAGVVQGFNTVAANGTGGFSATGTATVLGGFNTTVSLTGGYNQAQASVLTQLSLTGGNNLFIGLMDPTSAGLVSSVVTGFNATGTAAVLGGFNTTVSLTGGYNQIQAGVLTQVTQSGGGNNTYAESITSTAANLIAGVVQGFNATGTATVLGGFNTTVSLTGGYNQAQASILTKLSLSGGNNLYIGLIDATSAGLVASVVNAFNTAPASLTGGFSATGTAAVVGGFNTTVNLTGGYNQAQTGLLNKLTLADGHNTYIEALDSTSMNLVTSVVTGFNTVAAVQGGFSATGTAAVVGGFNTTVSLTGGFNQAQASVLANVSMSGGNNLYVGTLDTTATGGTLNTTPADLVAAVVNGFNAAAAVTGGFNATATATVLGGFNTTVSLTGGYNQAQATFLTRITESDGNNLYIGIIDSTGTNLIDSVVQSFNSSNAAVTGAFNALGMATVVGGFNTTVSLTGGYNVAQAELLTHLTADTGHNLYFEALETNALNLISTMTQGLSAANAVTVLNGLESIVNLTGGFNQARASVLTEVTLSGGSDFFLGGQDQPAAGSSPAVFANFDAGTPYDPTTAFTTLDAETATLVTTAVTGYSATDTAAVLNALAGSVSLSGDYESAQAGLLVHLQLSGANDTFTEQTSQNQFDALNATLAGFADGGQSELASVAAAYGLYVTLGTGNQTIVGGILGSFTTGAGNSSFVVEDPSLLGASNVNASLFQYDGDFTSGPGNNTFYFVGQTLGHVAVSESASSSDTLDFSNVQGSSISLNLGTSAEQQVATGKLWLTLTNPTAVTDVVGNGATDIIQGGSTNVTLLGAAPLDDRTTVTPPPMPRPQLVYLNFTTYNAPGQHVYTSAEQTAILNQMAANYAGFDFQFTLQQPASEPYVTVYFNDTPIINGVAQPGGLSSEIDFRNLNLSTTIQVDVNGLLGGAGQPPATSADFVAMSATIASHEVGHTAGLIHLDSFGPIGFGIHNPPGANQFLPPYPGPQAAWQSTSDIMASPAAVGSTLFDTLNSPYFGARDDVSLAFIEDGTVVNEQTPAPTSMAAAQPVTLYPMAVPNTIARGFDAGKVFSVAAVDVVGSIQASNGMSQSDYYSFQGRAGDLINMQVYSYYLTRITDPVDTELSVYDSSGNLVQYYSGTAFNDDGFETADASIIDLTLPSTGTYYVKLGSYSPTETGNYELLIYRFQAGNAIPMGGSEDTFIAGSGQETITGRGGNDIVEAYGAASYVLTNTSLIGVGAAALQNIPNAMLTGASGGSSFDVSGWTGAATLDGGSGGINTVILNRDANFTLSGKILTVSNGGTFTLDNIQDLVLTGGSSNDVFDLSGWTGALQVSIDGGSGAATLRGPNTGGTWTIAGPGSGNISGTGTGTVTFNSIANLRGGSSGGNVFKFLQGGSIAGALTGASVGDKLDYSSYTSPVTVNLQMSTASGIGATFANITSLAGNAATTLIGANVANTWNITGANAGTVNDFTFTSVANLMGGTNTDDFVFATGGSISGTVDGGSGGDTLAYASYPGGDSVSVNLQRSKASAIGGTFANIDALVGNAATTLIGPDAASKFTLTGANSGTFGSFSYSSVENLTGGGGNDTFAFATTGSITGNIDGGGGTNTLDYSQSTATLSVDLQESKATGIGGTFANISMLVGNTNLATLIGPDAGATFNLTGADSGTVGTFTYISVGNLTGGAGNDTFAFATAGSISGNIDGGGGANTLDYSAYVDSVMVNLTTGMATAIGGKVSNISNAIYSSATSVSSSANPSVYGQSVTFSATVRTNAANIAPTGVITFEDGSTMLGTGTLQVISGVDIATYSTIALAVGPHSITAVYGGTGSFIASSSIALSQIVNRDASGTSVSSSANPSVHGQSVTFTATVSPSAPGAGIPTGTVTFMDGSTTLGTGTMQVVGGVDLATYSTSAFAIGSHSISAVYGGDGNFTISTSAALSQTVNKAATSSIVVSSVNPSAYGQSVTFTATVSASAPGAGTPTGTVTFKDGTAILGTGTLQWLSGVDTATYSTSTLAIGAHNITTVYGGDGNFTTSTSAALSQMVNQAITSTSVSSSANPSVYGQSVTFTATVSAPGAGTPTGTVTFKNGSTTLGTATLSGGGASISTSALALGSDLITVSYAGNSNFSSSGGTITQVVSQDGATTTVSASPTSAVFGQSVTITATVTAKSPGSGTPTGTVTFMEGSTQLGTASLSSGKASIATTTLTVGSDTITVSYAGNSDFTSSSGTTTETVSQDGSTATISATPSSPVYGQQVTFTATVKAKSPSSGTPTGTVTFEDGSTTLGTGTLAIVNGADQATFKTSLLAAGAHSMTAVYNGDGNFTTSSSAALSQTVKAASTSTSGAISGADYFGQALTLSATVSALSPSNAIPSGSLDFFDTTSNTDLGTVSLSASGAATITATLPCGSQTITFAYKGTTNFLTSSKNVTVSILDSIYTLNSSASGALSISGTSSISIPGIVFVDSNSSSALQASTPAVIKAGSIQVVGGVAVTGGPVLSPKPVTGVAAVADPLASLPIPTAGTSSGSVSLSGSQSQTINPGVYTSIHVSGQAKLTMNPGDYEIAGGGFSVSGSASVTGKGVLIYNAGSNYPNGTGGTFGAISLGGSASVNLAATSTGTYAGVVFFQSRDNTQTMAASLNATLELNTGVFYAPSAPMALSGNSLVLDAVLVVNTLQLTSNADPSDGSMAAKAPATAPASVPPTPVGPPGSTGIPDLVSQASHLRPANEQGGANSSGSRGQLLTFDARLPRPVQNADLLVVSATEATAFVAGTSELPPWLLTTGGRATLDAVMAQWTSGMAVGTGSDSLQMREDHFGLTRYDGLHLDVAQVRDHDFRLIGGMELLAGDADGLLRDFAGLDRSALLDAAVSPISAKEAMPKLENETPVGSAVPEPSCDKPEAGFRGMLAWLGFLPLWEIVMGGRRQVAGRQSQERPRLSSRHR